MAQQAATPKARRRLLRVLAALAGPDVAARLPGIAASERAALALRAARAGGDAQAAEEVVFLIPLVGPHDVGDWQAVTARLRRTIGTLQAQDDVRWRAVICCQTRPDLPDDPRIAHLPFDDPVAGNDKWRKLATLCRHLEVAVARPAYIMSFDADDLLRQGTVAEMLARQAPGGYLATTGFVRDADTGDVALAGPPALSAPLRKPFWKLCGSCSALRHDPDLPESAAFLGAMMQHEHRMFPHLAALAGLKLTPFARPSVLYELNHGENFGARRGRVGFKTRFVRRFEVQDPQTLSVVAEDFGA